MPLTESSTPARARGIRAISPWRDQVAAAGLARDGAAVKRHGLELSGYCRGGMFPAADAAGRRAARDDNRRAVDEACTLSAPCLVLVVGGLPGALAGKAAHKRHRARARQVRDGIAATARIRARAPACRWPSSRCTRCMPPTAPASTRWSRRWTSATRSMPGGARGALGVAVDVYHVWWDPKLQAQIERAGTRAPARLSRLRLAHADHRPAQRPRHDGRRRDRHPAHPRLGRSARASRATARSRSSPRATGGSATGGEVLDTCIERHKTAV